MNFYGMLHAGSSRFLTRKGNHNGVRVAAVLNRPDARGYIETTLNEHGRWQVSIMPPPMQSAGNVATLRERGERVVVASGDLVTGEVTYEGHS
jgi:hypothetical protein